MVKLPEGAPKLEELLIDTGKMPWREKSLKGISEKMLWRERRDRRLDRHDQVRQGRRAFRSRIITRRTSS